MRSVRALSCGAALLLALLSLSAGAQRRQSPRLSPTPTPSPINTTADESTQTPTARAGQPSPSPAPATPARKMTFESALSNLRFREIGPAVMGGRIDDIEAVPGDPRTVYVATAAGGILK